MDDQRDYAEEAWQRAEVIREGMAELAEEQEELQRATPRDIPSVTLWACQCCTLVMANGECCDQEEHGGDGIEPLAEIPEGAHTTLGMMYEEHDEECLRHTLGSDAPVDHECDCERREFSWSACDACGSNLGGSRDAFVIWTPAAYGKCPKCGSECYWTNRTESEVDWFKCGNRDCATHYTQEELTRDV